MKEKKRKTVKTVAKLVERFLGKFDCWMAACLLMVFGLRIFLERANLIKKVTATFLPEVEETLRDMQIAVFF